MSIESSKQPSKNLSKSFDGNTENLTCKDGFCYIRSVDENKVINNENSNIFDPI